MWIFCLVYIVHFLMCESLTFTVFTKVLLTAVLLNSFVLKWLHCVVRWHCWHTCFLRPQDTSSEQKGCVSRLVSSPCLIYCPAAFEVGQAEFTSLWFFVISPPRLQPRWGPSPSTTGYRKYLSLIAPGYCIGTTFPNFSICNKLFQCTRPFCLYVMTNLKAHTVPIAS